MEIAIVILSIMCALFALSFILMQKRQSKMSKINTQQQNEISGLREASARLEARVQIAESQCELMKQQQATLSETTLLQQKTMVEQSEMRFKVLANELVANHSRHITQQNAESLNYLLTPLKDDIDKFRRDITSFYSKESAERFSLQERIKELIETNKTIGQEAKELSTALRGNSKIQGDWGEVVLNNILEKSGLRPGEEFEVQKQRDDSGNVLRNEEGRSLRPDVIVRYPGGKVMIIDSKTSLTAFVEYVNSETEEERERFGKLHLASVEKHVNELSEKNYQNYVGTQKLDFVMMFIPNEAAYNAAMSLNPTLWQKAYDKRVLIVSPTQLVASLKIVSQLWIQDRQTRNAIDIAEKAGGMYDKFVGFVGDMEKIERSLTATRTAYDSAMRKLRDGTGSLMVRAEKLRELGAKASKRLPKKAIAEDDELAS